jgi:hypothetical protein
MLIFVFPPLRPIKGLRDGDDKFKAFFCVEQDKPLGTQPNVELTTLDLLNLRRKIDEALYEDAQSLEFCKEVAGEVEQGLIALPQKKRARKNAAVEGL